MTVPWPIKGELLVRPTQPGENPMMNACFMRGTWDLYAAGYRTAATKLYEWIRDNERHQDTLVYPFVFLWRQYVELRLKEVVVTARHLCGEPRTTKWHHRIMDLWKEARGLLLRMQAGPPEELDVVEGRLVELENLDSDSQRVRYPLRTNGRESFPPSTKNLSIEQFQRTMTRVAGCLDCLAAYVSAEEDKLSDALGAAYEADRDELSDAIAAAIDAGVIEPEEP